MLGSKKLTYQQVQRHELYHKSMRKPQFSDYADL